MARSQKDSRERAAAAELPELAELAAGGNSFDRGFWEATPALAWVEDEAGRVSHCDADCRLSVPVPGAVPSAVPEGARPRFGGGPHATHEVERVDGPDGHEQYFLVVRFPFRSGTRRCLCHVALDVTAQHERLDELLHLAVEDELTGLYNRRGFRLFAEHELRAARRRHTHSAVIFVDIDGLKDINDRFGHEQGDAALVETARLLHDVFRECDVIARLGGDEFAVFAADVRGDPESLRTRLCARLADWRAACGDPATLRLSAGLAYSDAAQSRTLAQLLTEADVAMYADKAAKARPP